MAGAGGGSFCVQDIDYDQSAALVGMSADKKREQVEMTEGASV